MIHSITIKTPEKSCLIIMNDAEIVISIQTGALNKIKNLIL